MSAPEEFALSPTKRFIIFGDIWLSNRAQLLQKLAIDINQLILTIMLVINK